MAICRDGKRVTGIFRGGKRFTGVFRGGKRLWGGDVGGDERVYGVEVSVASAAGRRYLAYALEHGVVDMCVAGRVLRVAGPLGEGVDAAGDYVNGVLMWGEDVEMKAGDVGVLSEVVARVRYEGADVAADSYVYSEKVGDIYYVGTWRWRDVLPVDDMCLVCGGDRYNFTQDNPWVLTGRMGGELVVSAAGRTADFVGYEKVVGMDGMVEGVGELVVRWDMKRVKVGSNSCGMVLRVPGCEREVRMLVKRVIK